MNPVVVHIKWIMLVSGLLTCTMVYALIAPDAAFQSNFGEALQGPAGRLVVRNWGALITMMGLLLIYGALRPQYRDVALMVAGSTKLIFIVLVLAHGGLFLGHQAGVAVAIDAVWVILFAIYLLNRKTAADPR